MVKSDQHKEHKSTHIERNRSLSQISQTTTDKMTVVLSLRSLKELTEKLEQYKSTMKHLSQLLPDLSITMNELQLLPSLNQDSQRTNQSSQAVQSTLEALNNLFSLNK